MRRISQLNLLFSGDENPPMSNGDDIIYAYHVVEDGEHLVTDRKNTYPLVSYPESLLEERRWEGRERLLVQLAEGSAEYIRSAWHQQNMK